MHCGVRYFTEGAYFRQLGYATGQTGLKPAQNAPSTGTGAALLPAVKSVGQVEASATGWTEPVPGREFSRRSPAPFLGALLR
jgi:hypothetical protein